MDFSSKGEKAFSLRIGEIQSNRSLGNIVVRLSAKRIVEGSHLNNA